MSSGALVEARIHFEPLNQFRRDNPLKHFAIPLLLAVLIYIVAYASIEHLRNRKGPWQVTFTHVPQAFSTSSPLPNSSSSFSAAPLLIINQPALGITNVQIIFTNAPLWKNPPAHLAFSHPKPVPYDLPFGRCIFMDTTFLPGTLTMQMFGHELELLPRVLIIDHQEHDWRPRETFLVSEPTKSP